MYKDSETTFNLKDHLWTLVPPRERAVHHPRRTRRGSDLRRLPLRRLSPDDPARRRRARLSPVRERGRQRRQRAARGHLHRTAHGGLPRLRQVREVQPLRAAAGSAGAVRPWPTATPGTCTPPTRSAGRQSREPPMQTMKAVVLERACSARELRLTHGADSGGVAGVGPGGRQGLRDQPLGTLHADGGGERSAHPTAEDPWNRVRRRNRRSRPTAGCAKGQRVVALMGGMGRSFDGSYAEYALLPSSHVFAVEAECALGRARGDS